MIFILLPFDVCEKIFLEKRKEIMKRKAIMDLLTVCIIDSFPIVDANVVCFQYNND
jgi:hypothetical protein